jgi:hypothetical protein
MEQENLDMKRYVPAFYFLGSLLSILISSWALRPMTLISYFLWIALGPITLPGFISLAGWHWRAVVEVGLIYSAATLGLGLCYWIGLRGSLIARWTMRLGIAVIWLMCAGFNLWIVGMST